VGQQATSEQLVIDALEGPGQVNTVATARGAYIQRVDALVRVRWAERDLPAQLRGIGIRGSVTVGFDIRSNGKTHNVGIVAHSGNEWLDLLAHGAIPPRLPKVPKEVSGAGLRHEITFHYW
jgi:outer membrane biosynthesis protein TonB